MLFRVTRIFLATTAHCHDRAAIKIHITTFNRINLHVRYGNLHRVLTMEMYLTEIHKLSKFVANRINLHVRYGNLHRVLTMEMYLTEIHKLSKFIYIS